MVTGMATAGVSNQLPVIALASGKDVASGPELHARAPEVRTIWAGRVAGLARLPFRRVVSALGAHLDG